MTAVERRAETAITKAIKAAEDAGAPATVLMRLLEAKQALVQYRTAVERLREAA